MVCAMRSGGGIPTLFDSKPGSCIKLQWFAGSRHEENPVAFWFQRHSVLCAQREDRKRRPDLTLDCKLGQTSAVAESLSSPAPFVEYSHAEVPGNQSNVFSSSGSMDHMTEDATRFSSIGGAERLDKVGPEEAQLGRCIWQDGDDVSHSHAPLYSRPPCQDHGPQVMWTSSREKASSPETDAGRGVECSPCQRHKDDLPDSSCLANDSSDTATVYGLNMESCAYVARKCSGRSASPDAERQACS